MQVRGVRGVSGPRGARGGGGGVRHVLHVAPPPLCAATGHGGRDGNKTLLLMEQCGGYRSLIEKILYFN